MKGILAPEDAKEAPGGGEAGVAHILRIIREEMHVAVALTGNTRLEELGPEVLDLA